MNSFTDGKLSRTTQYLTRSIVSSCRRIFIGTRGEAVPASLPEVPRTEPVPAPAVGLWKEVVTVRSFGLAAQRESKARFYLVYQHIISIKHVVLWDHILVAAGRYRGCP